MTTPRSRVRDVTTGHLSTPPILRSSPRPRSRDDARPSSMPRFLVDLVPGYENASLVALSSQIGLRETRRVYGDYRVTRDDVLGARQFDDQIGLCGAPIEDHVPGTGTRWEYLPEGGSVGIPSPPSFHATASTHWSPGDVSRPLMTPRLRSGRWRSAWRWGKRQARRRRWQPRAPVRSETWTWRRCGTVS